MLPSAQHHQQSAPLQAWPCWSNSEVQRWGTCAVPWRTTREVQELEEDPEMRKHVALFKAEADVVAAADTANDMDDDDAAEERELDVPLEELLDDLHAIDLDAAE